LLTIAAADLLASTNKSIDINKLAFISKKINLITNGYFIFFVKFIECSNIAQVHDESNSGKKLFGKAANNAGTGGILAHYVRAAMPRRAG